MEKKKKKKKKKELSEGIEHQQSERGKIVKKKKKAKLFEMKCLPTKNTTAQRKSQQVYTKNPTVNYLIVNVAAVWKPLSIKPLGMKQKYKMNSVFGTF